MARTFLFYFLIIPQFLFSQNKEEGIPSFIQQKIALAEKENNIRKKFAEAIQLLHWGKVNNGPYVNAHAYKLIAEVYRPRRGKKLLEADSLFEYYASASGRKALQFEALRLYITDLLNDNSTNKVKPFLDRADALAGAQSTAYEKGVLNQLKGFYYYKKFDPKTAISFYRKSIEYAEMEHNEILKAASLSQISSCYTLRMNTDSAAFYASQALSIHKKSNNYFEVASDYGRLAFLFRTSANKALALQYYLEAIKYYTKSNAPVNIAYTNLQLGEMYIGWNQPTDALPYLQNARSSFEDLNYGEGLSLTYSLLARYYSQTKNSDSANFFTAKAKSASVIENSVTRFYSVGHQIAQETELKNFKKSDSLLKALLPEVEKVYSEESVFKAINKIGSGADSVRKFMIDIKLKKDNINRVNTNDSVINPFTGFPNEKDSLINSLIQQNQKTNETVNTMKRQLVRDSLNHANEQIALNEKELKIKNLGLIIFSIIILASVIIIYFIFQSRKRINGEKNYTLHYARGNMAIINANISQIRKDSSFAKEFELLKQKIFPLNTLYDLMETKLTEKIYLHDYLNKICTNVSKAYSLNKDIQTKVTAPVYLQGKKAQVVGFIVNELVINSFKYAFTDRQDGEINVICTKQKKEYQLSVVDNGKGYDEKITKKGEGSKLVAGLVQQLSAKEVKKSNPGGTSFELYFS